ncbi:MAG: outer membrane protein transport protein [Polyangiales bacterium]
MRRACGVMAVVLAVIPGVAAAENTNQVVAGTDVALTGGAVVANVQTGGALWYNPAGVARLDARSVTLSGALLDYRAIRAPGALSIESGEQSAGDYSSIHVVPRALVFVLSPKPKLRWGIGFFFSRSLSDFVQDSVSTDANASEPAEFLASSNRRELVYHLSSAIAWKKSKKLLVGGGLDLVFASQRMNESIAGSYGQGQGGALSSNLSETISGAGLQMKAGIQWAPIEALRIGWMVATPSYLTFLSQKNTTTQTLAPPAGAPEFTSSQTDQLNGAWAGVEAGLTRFGLAYLGSWGWIEGDLVLSFPLHSAELDIDWRTTADVHLGAVLKVTSKLDLGCGFFTNFSPQPTPSRFAETQVNLYGLTVGADFANRAEPIKTTDDGFYLALAVAFRYAHGSGTLAGVTFPSAYPSAGTQPAAVNLVEVKVNELSVNLAFKAAF